MADATVRGRFVWHELLTTDPKSAATFFSKVIGWKIQPWGEDASYTLFLSGDRQMAGLVAQPEDAREMGAPPSWLTYVGTPNVDETARQASSLGATVLKAPEDIPTIGRFAVIQDPQGAVFAAFTPNRPPAAESDLTVGDFSWHELATTDVKAALAFYHQLFGWEETSAMEMGPDLGTYYMFGRSKNGPTLGGAFNKPTQMPGPPSWLPYIKVDDAKTTADAVRKLRGKIVNGPTEVPGGDWIAQGLDLQGAMFAVHSLKPPASQPASTATLKDVVVKKTAPKKAAPKKAATKNRTAVKKLVKAVARRVAKQATAVKKAALSAAKRTFKKATGKTTAKPANKAAAGKRGKAPQGKKNSKRR